MLKKLSRTDIVITWLIGAFILCTTLLNNTFKDDFKKYDNSTLSYEKARVISVIKENRLINMDSQVTNKMVCEALKDKSLILTGFDEERTLIKPEKTYGNSRFDVYLEGKTKKALIEIKGCTLEEDNIVKFPDAKTDRGVKHVKELINAKEDGFLAYIIIVIQI